MTAAGGAQGGAESLSALLVNVREEHPLVQCITNAVTVNFVANVLLALDAAPAMVDMPGEAGACAAAASALLINLGTPNADSVRAMHEAVRAARETGKPWILDPVAVGSLPVRTALAGELLRERPTIVRGNASEIIALAGAGRGGRGVDSTAEAESALDAATRLTRVTGGAVAISGPTDIVTDGTCTLRLGNGHEYLTRVTGGGCALGASMAAFAGTGASALRAAAAATLAYTVAAEVAAVGAAGPGSFAAAFLDRLATLTPSALAAHQAPGPPGTGRGARRRE